MTRTAAHGAGLWLLGLTAMLTGHPLFGMVLMAAAATVAARGVLAAARRGVEPPSPERPSYLSGGPVVVDGGVVFADDGHGRLLEQCRHQAAVEVRRVPVPAVGVEADVVAWYCPPCDAQLPASFVPPESSTVIWPQNIEARAQDAAALGGITMAEASENIRVAFTRRTRYGTREQIEAAGYEAVEVTALGDADPLYIRGPRRP